MLLDDLTIERFEEKGRVDVTVCRSLTALFLTDVELNLLAALLLIFSTLST